MKKNASKIVLATLGVTIGVATTSPTLVNAQEPASTEQTDETKEELKEFGKKTLDWFIKANEFVEDKIEKGENAIINYKQESLWLITDTPNIDPNEERNFYFVYNKGNIPYTTFYDAYGNKVEKNSPVAVRKYSQERYAGVAGSDKIFMIRSYYDLKNNTFTTNYVDFDTDYLWEENEPLEFGRFANINDIIPEDMQKEKYTIEDLQEIIAVINDCNYDLSPTTRRREIPKN